MIKLDGKEKRNENKNKQKANHRQRDGKERKTEKQKVRYLSLLGSLKTMSRKSLKNFY